MSGQARRMRPTRRVARSSRGTPSLARLEAQISSLRLATNDNTVLLRSPFDPPVLKNDAIYQRTVQFTAEASASAPLRITPTLIAGQLGLPTPALPSVNLALNTIKAWGPAAAGSQLNVEVLQNPLITSSVVRFSDHGTQGSRRPGVALQFAKAIREIFHPGLNNLPILASVFPASTTPTQIVVQISVRFRFQEILE